MGVLDGVRQVCERVGSGTSEDGVKASTGGWGYARGGGARFCIVGGRCHAPLPVSMAMAVMSAPVGAAARPRFSSHTHSHTL